MYEASPTTESASRQPPRIFPGNTSVPTLQMSLWRSPRS
uniref:Uncharacterized protein n=1 Tax=Nelumbo nucifera TaxID=4432 RepID=A0A822YXE1_NELNU|nr:TPA_asm: hypothetical protein HUJ06_006475 [Nelumbo nucifera]